MNDRVRYALDGAGTVVVGLLVAVVIVAVALPLLLYVLWTNWKDYTL